MAKQKTVTKKSTALARKDSFSKVSDTKRLMPAAQNPEAMLSMAVQSGQDVQIIRELMALAKEWKAEKAKEEFNQAMTLFQAEVPAIPKLKKVNQKKKDNSGQWVDGGPAYKHAELDHIVTIIQPFKAKHGLSHDWANEFFLQRRLAWLEEAKSVQEYDVPMIRITCTVTHKNGFSKSAFIEAEHDKSGSKNKIQERASTITYGQRYSLIAAFGLVTAGVDDDGRGSEPEANTKKAKEKPTDLKPPMSDEQFNKAFVRIKDGEDLLPKLKEAYTMNEKQIHGLESADDMRKNKSNEKGN